MGIKWDKDLRLYNADIQVEKLLSEYDGEDTQGYFMEILDILTDNKVFSHYCRKMNQPEKTIYSIRGRNTRVHVDHLEQLLRVLGYKLKVVKIDG